MTKPLRRRINVFTVKLVKESGKLYELDTKTVRSPRDGADIIKTVLNTDELPNEHFIMLSLSTKNEVIGFHTIFVGSLNASIVHPREIFQQALLNNAASIIVAHNHPSGDPTPSQEDIHVTRRLVEAGKILGIELLDHLILGHGDKFVSLKEKGYL